MSTESTGPLTVEKPAPAISAIENEIPTYRAISTRAVFSLVCGALAALSIADLMFLVFAVLAIVLGLLAHVSIKRYPDQLTGRRLANAGISLGLVFGLTVITYTVIQGYILSRSASKFALEYARALKEGSLGDALLYREGAEQRKGKTAEQAEKEFQNMSSRERGPAELRIASLQKLRKALAPKEAHIHLHGIESQGVDESRVGKVYYFATAVFEVEGSPGVSASEGNNLALAVLKGDAKGRHYEWYVEDVIYPYIRKTYQAESKPVDDGHGHAH